jgi:uroporphyrinogen-III synthase
MSTTTRSLTLLLICPRQSLAQLTSRLPRDCPVRCLEYPVLDLSPRPGALDGQPWLGYDAMILSSRFAAELVLAQSPEPSRLPPVLAVGPSVAEAGLPVHLIPERYGADGLAESMALRYRVSGSRYLIVGQDSSPARRLSRRLREMGAFVEQLIAYEATEIHPQNEASLAAYRGALEPRAQAITSPRCARLSPANLGGMNFCLGKRTAEALLGTRGSAEISVSWSYEELVRQVLDYACNE